MFPVRNKQQRTFISSAFYAIDPIWSKVGYIWHIRFTFCWTLKMIGIMFENSVAAAFLADSDGRNQWSTTMCFTLFKRANQFECYSVEKSNIVPITKSHSFPTIMCIYLTDSIETRVQCFLRLNKSNLEKCKFVRGVFFFEFFFVIIFHSELRACVRTKESNMIRILEMRKKTLSRFHNQMHS